MEGSSIHKFAPLYRRTPIILWCRFGAPMRPSARRRASELRLLRLTILLAANRLAIETPTRNAICRKAAERRYGCYSSGRADTKVSTTPSSYRFTFTFCHIIDVVNRKLEEDGRRGFVK